MEQKLVTLKETSKRMLKTNSVPKDFSADGLQALTTSKCTKHIRHKEFRDRKRRWIKSNIPEHSIKIDR